CHVVGGPPAERPQGMPIQQRISRNSPTPRAPTPSARADQAKPGELNVASPRRSARQVIAPGYEPPPIQPVAPRGRSYRTRYIFVIGVPLRWKSTLISDWSGLRMMNS